MTSIVTDYAEVAEGPMYEYNGEIRNEQDTALAILDDEFGISDVNLEEVKDLIKVAKG